MQPWEHFERVGTRTRKMTFDLAEVAAAFEASSALHTLGIDPFETGLDLEADIIHGALCMVALDFYCRGWRPPPPLIWGVN